MKFIFSLVLVLVLGCIYPSTSYGVGPFPSILDHAHFVQLPREAQREYVRIVMMAMVDLEEGHRRIQKLPDTPANLKLKKTSAIRLEQFKTIVTQLFGAFGVADAHAVRRRTSPPAATIPHSSYCHDIRGNTVNVEAKGKCVIGGWESTFVKIRSTGAQFCQRPACSVDPEIRRKFSTTQQGCGPSKSLMACNTDLYGTKEASGAGGPICINVDQIDTQNASLACLIEFEKRPNYEARIDSLVANITSGRGNAGHTFNTMARMIFNICACGPEFAAQTDLHPDYIKYMQSHRTCYSLLGMMRIYVDKIKNQTNSCNPLNVTTETMNALSSDLGHLTSFTDRVARLGNIAPGALNQNNYATILQRFRSRFVTDGEGVSAGNARHPGHITRHQSVANQGVALDFVNSIDQSVNNSATNAKLWCPLQLPPAPSTASCEISLSDVTLPGKQISASITLTPAPEGAVAYAWTVNGTAVANANGASLQTTGGEEIVAGSTVSVAATATANGVTLACPPQSKTLAAPPADGDEDTAEILVVGNRVPPVVIPDPGPLTVDPGPIELTEVPIIETIPEVVPPVVPPAPTEAKSCKLDFSVTRTKDTDNVVVSGTITKTPTTLETGAPKWTLAGSTETITGDASLTVSKTLTVPQTQTDLSTIILSASLPEIGDCVGNRTPAAEDEDDEEDDDGTGDEDTAEPAPGKCGLTALPSTAGKFKLRLAVADGDTVESITWSENVTPKPEDNTKEIELATPSKPTKYEVKIVLKDVEDNEIKEECSEEYPKATAPAYTPPAAATQQMPSIIGPSIINYGMD